MIVLFDLSIDTGRFGSGKPSGYPPEGYRIVFRCRENTPMIGPTLEGGLVNLRPLCDADLGRRVAWLGDVETTRLFTGAPPARVYSQDDADWWRRNLEDEPTAIVWAVETKQNKHIGDVDLHKIDHSEKSAKLTILIGEKAFWNRGCGTDAIKTILCYAFSKLRLESVTLRVYDFNKRAVKCYERCGFVHTGTIPPDPSAPHKRVEIGMVITKGRFLSGK